MPALQVGGALSEHAAACSPHMLAVHACCPGEAVMTCPQANTTSNPVGAEGNPGRPVHTPGQDDGR